MNIDCKTAVFFANASDGPYSNERSVASEKKRRGRMVRDAKKYGCPPCIYQIRSGNSHWSNPDAICHQNHTSSKICSRRINFTGKPDSRGKLDDVDLMDLASDLGFVLKAEQMEAVESLLRAKDVFGVLPTGFGKSLIFQLIVLAKNRASSSPNASVER